MERRHSTDSNDSSVCSKQGSDDVPAQGRVSKTASPKPPANALQFVKTGPCNLYQKAQEQIKKAEEIKKDKTVLKFDAEEWQSNLDNWKSSRRKMQEHIIERVVEVKKLELEEHERNRKKIKTLSEMMQERGQKGRINSIPIYDEEENNDLSDLGLGKPKSSKNSDGLSSLSSQEEEENGLKDDLDNLSSYSLGKNQEYEEKDLSDRDSKYADSMKKCDSYVKSNLNYSTFTNQRNHSFSGDSKIEKPTVPVKPRRSLTCSVGIESSKYDLKKSLSSTDISDSSKKVLMPKVDINKRRELFERSEFDVKYTKVHHSSVDLNSSKSIKERLSFLEKQSEMNKIKKERPAAVASVKDRLTSIENLKTAEPCSKPKTDDPVSSTTIKDRLSSLEKASANTKKSQSVIEPSVRLKDRLSSLKAACDKEITKTEVSEVESNFCDKLNPFQDLENEENLSDNFNYHHEELDSLYVTKKQLNYCHRSLDSLDIDSVPSGSFERVQSYDDLEYCRNYPASSVSGDTDREDSGIHTADVSSSVSQADDFDLHPDANLPDDLKLTHRLTVVEEIKCKSPVGFVDNVSSLKDSSDCSRSCAKLDSSSLPAILESPAENSPEISLLNHLDPEHSSHSDSLIGLSEKEDSSLLPPPISVNNLPSENSKTFIAFEENTISSEENESIEPDVPVVSATNTELLFLEDTLEKTIMELPIESFINKEKEPNDIISTANQILNVLQQEEEEEDINIRKHHIVPEQLSSTLVVDMNMISDVTTVFPLSPSALEPPKEKPPPPPVDLSDDEDNPKPIQRFDSTKRIKKEIRLKRSSFLGLEGNDESYIDPELERLRPPDVATLLAEERQLEKQLHRQSLCSETDSNQESRDSGVELDNRLSAPSLHSRDNSDNICNNSSTSDEDDIIRKEREIIETLEKEEMIRKQQLGEKLAMRLRELEVEKDEAEWERLHHEVNGICNEKSINCGKLDPFNESLEDPSGLNDTYNEGQMWYDQTSDTETSRDGTEQKTLEPTQKTYNQQFHSPAPNSQYPTRMVATGPVNPYRYHSTHNVPPSRDSRPAVLPPIQPARRSMPDLRSNGLKPAPPALPAKPPHLSRPPNAHQSMSREALQTLSAAPRSRIISSESWQVKQKPKQEQPYYQHWLIQEAEHRRITEQQIRQQQQQNWNRQQQQKQKQEEDTWNGGWVQKPRTGRPPPLAPQWGAGNPLSPPVPRDKPLPDSIIQTLTQRVQNRMADSNNNRRARYENVTLNQNHEEHQQEKVLSVSGKKRCSACGDELGKGAAMIIESLQLFYHIECFKCCVCCLQLGDGLMGTDVRVRSNKLHCHNCYSSDDGVKFSCV